MRALITGSSGQIGTNLALHLLERGHSVFGVDKRPNTWTNAFPYLLQDLSVAQTTHEHGIGGADYPEVDVVIHFAAHAKVHELVRDPRRALENITMTFNVLEYCRKAGRPVVFSSSREVYGDIHRYMDGDASTIHEAAAHFAYTESPYSASKIAGEALVYSYARCYDLPYLVFRFSNVYGRFDNDIERMERVIPLFIRRIAQDEPITVYGADKTLDFTYVDDCVAGIAAGVQTLHERSITNQTINLACGQGNSLLRLTELIAVELGATPQLTIEPTQVGEVTHYVADISKARRLLGFDPQVPLEEGIRRCVAWNREWWAKGAS